MKKKYLYVFFTLVILLSACYSIDAFENVDYEYGLYCNDLITIKKYIGDDTNVTIPNKIANKYVGYFDAYSFAYNTKIESVSIPSTVSSIGHASFLACSSLLNIDVASNNKSYQSKAGVLYSKDMTTLIQYPAGIKSEKFDIPVGTEKIEDNAFEQCNNLTDITIPNITEYIGDCTFYDCKSLKNIFVDEYNKYYSSYNGVLFNYSKSLLIQYPNGIMNSNYTIPNTVTTIGTLAFAKSYNLKSVTIPSTVINIESDAFEDIDNLIIYGEKGSYSEIFANKNKILFEETRNLKEKKYYKYEILDNKVTITKYTGSQENVIVPLVIDNTIVNKIGENAFSNTSVKSVKLSKNIQVIDATAFNNSHNLTSIIVDSENPIYTTFNNVLFNKDKTKLLKYPSANIRESYTIPKSVSSIETNSFSSCSKLKIITVFDNVTYISESAFNNKNNIVLKGYLGSYAEKYAYKYKYLFYLLLE